MTKEALDWIMIDGVMVRNVIDLCPDDHFDLEDRPGGHRARLRWLSGNGWGWYIRPPKDFDGEAIWWFDPRTREGWAFKGFITEGVIVE